jgi:carbon monoxide dehydrogenase subunit G
VEEVVPPSTYKGTIRLKIGPMTVTYRGQATLVELDEAAHRATIEMKAREARGQGSALAVVRNRLEPAPGGTRVLAETDLQITGPQAQFGKGVLEDVGSRILAEFSERLERMINEERTDARSVDQGSAAQGDGDEAPRAERDAAEDDVLDLNKVVSASLRSRVLRMVPAVAAALAMVAVLVVIRRRAR